MIKHKLDCCIQISYNNNKESISNITDIYFHVKSCFHPNQSFTDVIMYVLTEHKPVEKCTLRSTKAFECTNQKNSITPVLIALWVIIMLVAVLGNSLVCYVIHYTRSLRKLITNHFIASLAVSDLMVGLLLVPIRTYSTARTGGFCLDRVLCHFYMTLDNICFVASITNLLVITTDRFIAIDWPYAYQDIVTKKRSKIAIMIVWLYAGLMGGLANVRWEKQPADAPDNICWTQNKGYITFVFTTVFYLPALFMGIAQARMLIIALQHSREIVSAVPLQDISKEPDDEETASSKVHVKEFVTRVKKVLKEYHAVKMVMMVYGTFVACWIPVSVIALLHVWCPKCSNVKQWHTVVFVEFLPILNSTMNVFIYSVMNREFRKAFRRLLRKAYLWCTDDIG